MSKSLIIRHMENQCKYLLLYLVFFSQRSKSTFTFITKIYIYINVGIIDSEKNNQNNEDGSVLNVI